MSRLSEIYEIEPEQNEEENKLKDIDLDGNIVLDKVSFKYGARANVLDELSLTFPKGKKVALVGQSGAGKTTIAKLLLNFYEVNDGRVLLNDYDIKDIDIKYLRNKVGYVSQNIELFTGKIIDNIKVGNPNKKYEEIIKASKKAGCHEFIEKMPGRWQAQLQVPSQGGQTPPDFSRKMI
ncbi:ATP-binding cassette domain-containing protein [Clostridium sp. DL1XJH146]